MDPRDSASIQQGFAERLATILSVNKTIEGALYARMLTRTHVRLSEFRQPCGSQRHWTVIFVDADYKTISNRQMKASLAITASTEFHADMQLDKLNPGTTVELAFANADNNAEAVVEVYKAG